MGNFGGLFGPKIPKPAQVAEAQRGQNLFDTELRGASRVSQEGPGIGQSFQFGPVDPVTGLRSQASNIAFSPENQSIFGQELSNRLGIGQGIGGLIGNASGILSQPFNVTQAGFDAALGGAGLIARLNAPFWKDQEDREINRLRNQGLFPSARNTDVVNPINPYDKAIRQLQQNQSTQFGNLILPWQAEAARQSLQSYQTIPSTIATLLGLGTPSQGGVGLQNFDPFAPAATNMSEIFKNYINQGTQRANDIGSLLGGIGSDVMKLPLGVGSKQTLGSTLGGTIGGGIGSLLGLL